MVRSCQLEDSEALKKFLQKGAIESKHALVYKEYEESLSELKTRIENALNSPSEIYVGAFDESKFIGQLHLKALSSEHPQIKHLAESGMMISSEYWRQGIGKALLEFMENFARQIGIYKIEAKVCASNESGLVLYKKVGYTIEGIRKKAALINGQFEDEFFIATLL